MDYRGGSLPLLPHTAVLEDLGGHARRSIDTAQLPVSQALAALSAQTEVTDISVTGQSIDELVVSLYQEFAI